MQPHSSSALRYASAAQAVHSRVYGGCTAEAAASEASGPRVSGCIRESAKLRPSPVAGQAVGRYQQHVLARGPETAQLNVVFDLDALGLALSIHVYVTSTFSRDPLYVFDFAASNLAWRAPRGGHSLRW